MSSLIGGRSGNRGECAGSCRLRYDVIDSNNKRLNMGDYPLSTKDLNTLEYVGFELQRFDKKAERFIQEVNESDPFNARNCSIALRPNIAIITNIDKSHIGEFGSEELIIEAVKDITAGMEKDDYVIINLDDKNSTSIIDSINTRIVSVGIENDKADCCALNIEEHHTSIEFDLRYNQELVHFWLPVSGKHNVYNILAAIALGREF